MYSCGAVTWGFRAQRGVQGASWEPQVWTYAPRGGCPQTRPASQVRAGTSSSGQADTHKGCCRSVCSLSQYFWRNFCALSSASTEPGWLATARFTTCRGQGTQRSPGPPHAHAHGWEASAEATGDRLVAWQVSLLGAHPWEVGTGVTTTPVQGKHLCHPLCVPKSYLPPAPALQETGGCGPPSEPVRGPGWVGPFP